MGRRKLLRRFEPRYGVSAAAIEAEADTLAREAKDYELLALSDLDAKRVERHANTEHCWEQLQLILADLPERERKTLQCLLFRDFYHILELYLAHLRRLEPASASPPRSAAATVPPDKFSEWLFAGKEGA